MRKFTNLKKESDKSRSGMHISGIKMIILTIISCFFFQYNIYAQETAIAGTVTDANGLTLPGVNIVIKGTTTGAVTDANGEFSINAKPSDILIVTYIGYEKKEVEVGDRKIVKITLAEDVSQLNEVIVIGYGTQKKKLITGATSQVKGEQIEKRNAIGALESVQGTVAGLNITPTSGQPGSDMKVNIRGLGTIQNATPLYIVDGVQTGDISYLNPADIASFDVLKDAASAAIYGNQAANGVILITTKKGEILQDGSGQKSYSQVTFDAYYGYQDREKKISTLNTEEYAMIMNEQHLNSGGSPSTLPFNMNDLPAYTSEGVANTDWLNEMFVNDAVTENYVVGFNGGTQYSSLSMSLSYTGQQGIVGGEDLSDYNRYGARINSEHKLFEGVLNVGENFTFSYVKSRGISVGNQYDNTLRGAFNTSPLLPVYDNDGNFFNSASETIVDQHGDTYWNDQEANPYASMVINNQNINRSQKLIGNIFAELNFTKNLKFRTSLGMDYWASSYRTYTPIYQLSIYSFSDHSKVTQEMQSGIGLTWDNQLTYTKNIGKHHLTGMVGSSAQQYSGTWLYGENVDLAFNDMEHAWLDNATNITNITLMSIEGAPLEDNRMMSYFGRVQYNYNETYLFNATFRADGSSKFADGHRWGYFPSLSAGWVMTNQDFMENIKGVLPYFKLRGSWGQVGNCNIDPFQYLAPISFTNAQYNFGDEEGVSYTGSYPSRLSNPDLTWETSEQLDFGFDAGLFNSNLFVNFDYYRKISKNWLIKAPVLATAGTEEPFINGGDVHNNGVELGVTWQDNAGEFQYRVNVVGAYNKNEVTNIPTEDGIIHGAANSLYNNSTEFYRCESGHSIGYFWGFETDGIFQTGSEVTSYVSSDGTVIMPNAQPGDLRYVDQNDDGVINDDDKIDLGDPNPDFSFGITFSCDWKGLDFMLVANGVMGNQIVQSYRGQSGMYSNYTDYILDRWTGPGTSNSVPRVTNTNINYRFSDIFVQNGDYLRLSNITIGYDLARVIKIKSLSQFRIYASVQNLYTFTNYTGMDPDIGYGLDNGVTDMFSSGIDLGFYPHARTFLFGINIKY